MKFNNNFQLEILALLVQDSIFLGTHQNIILPEHFQVKDHKLLCELIREFAKQYYSAPSEQVLTFMVEQRNLHHLTKTVQQLYQPRDNSHLAFVRDTALQFAKRRAVKNAIRASNELLSFDEDSMDHYDEIEDLIRKALIHGEAENIGMCLYSDMDPRIDFRKEDLGDPVPTLWYEVDKCLGGGAFPKTLICLLAGTNVGKSAALVNIGACAVVQGLVVFHYTLEMSEGETLARYDSRLTNTGMVQVMLDDPDVNTAIKTKLMKWQQYGGEVVVKEFATGTATVGMIRAHIDRVNVEMGLKPDIIIIDYGDIMKHARFNEYRHQLGSTFISLRQLAVEQNVPLWTATQTNRAGMSKETVDLTDVAEDMEKVRISDTVLALCQTEEEEEMGLMRIFGAKVRKGKKGWVVPVRIDFNTMFMGNDLR